MILRQTLASVDLDRNSLPQTDLNIANRVRTNPFPWTGQFSPQLAEQLLAAYTPRAGVVLDPFVGSGTSLMEAARLGLPAIGAELNPAAVVLSQVLETRLAQESAARRVAEARVVELEAFLRQLRQAVGIDPTE